MYELEKEMLKKEETVIKVFSELIETLNNNGFNTKLNYFTRFTSLKIYFRNTSNIVSDILTVFNIDVCIKNSQIISELYFDENHKVKFDFNCLKEDFIIDFLKRMSKCLNSSPYDLLMNKLSIKNSEIYKFYDDKIYYNIFLKKTIDDREYEGKISVYFSIYSVINEYALYDLIFDFGNYTFDKYGISYIFPKNNSCVFKVEYKNISETERKNLVSEFSDFGELIKYFND